MTDHTTHFDDAQSIDALDRAAQTNSRGQHFYWHITVGRALLTLEAERDTLRLRVSALEANLIDALNMVCKEGNSAYDCAVALTDVVTRSKGDITALRAMLVEAVRESDKWREETPESIADRILGANKGGVE